MGSSMSPSISTFAVRFREMPIRSGPTLELGPDFAMRNFRHLFEFASLRSFY
jgi:hypothetical protein